MQVNIFFTKLLKNKNPHSAIKTLLILALSQKLKNKFSINKLTYKKNKWVYPKIYLSASHCKNNVIVAISLFPVGIDLEEKNNKLLNKKIWHRILTKNEAKKYKQYSKVKLLMLWTKKEAIFKMGYIKQFIPNKIDTLRFNVKTYQIGKNLLCSISNPIVKNNL